MASVTYENVTKSFGAVEVIKGVDLNIQDGELVVFVGPSGCGKSTLLRMIAGLETATSGTLKIGDRKVNDVPPKERDIAMVFQNYALYPHMTVAENISFGLKLRGMGKAERREAAKKAATVLGIENLLDRRPKELSGGQRQRVAMGRAIVRDPAVFLMDEPLSNLDAKLRTQMRVEIRKMQHRLGTTTIYVTHDQVEAMTLADRIAVLEGGYVRQFGTPDELYHHPANKFVAGFLGSPAINFLPASLQGATLDLPGGEKVKLASERLPGAKDGEQVEVAVRPENIHIQRDSTALPEGWASWQAEVSLVEALGSENLVYTRMGEHEVTAKITDNTSIREGDTCTFAFELSRAHLFHAADGTLLSSGAKA